MFSNRPRGLARTGRTIRELDLRSVWPELRSRQGTRTDTTVGAIRIVTFEDSSWLILDWGGREVNDPSIMDQPYRNAIERKANQQSQQVQPIRYNPTTGQIFNYHTSAPGSLRGFLVR